MLERDAVTKLKSLLSSFPTVTLTGCRQCGKSTLLKNAFPDWNYVSLEDLDIREIAKTDPRYFLSLYSKHTIFDEIQRVPSLFSYIQTYVDSQGENGIYIFSGSQNFLLMESVSQSLAGRTAILNLAPFSFSELKKANLLPQDLNSLLFKGFYPRIYDKSPNPYDYYQSYIKTYIERDVRNLKNITNLSTFQKFIKLCAGRIGQLLNITELSNEAGINVATAKSWLSLLEASYIIFTLKPYYQNYGKRLVKSSKIYFYDTGLVCNLLGIENEKQIETFYLRGSLFENLIISEYRKKRFFQGYEPNMYFWRDSNGLEVDLVTEENTELSLYEIKSSQTMNKKFFDSIIKFCTLSKITPKEKAVIYGGDLSLPQTTEHAGYISWKDW